MADSKYKTYRINPGSITRSEAFADASVGELKLLLAIIDSGGALCSAEELAEVCGISRARANAALALWQDSGILTEGEGISATVLDEYEPRKENEDESARFVASLIRDEELQDMYHSLSEIMERTLPPEDVKKVSVLYTTYELSPAFILELAAYMNEKNESKAKRLNKPKTKLRPGELVRKAISLKTSFIETLEELEEWIKQERLPHSVLEIKKLLGIKGRNLSETEISYFKNWTENLGYSKGIIGKAFDIAVMHADSGPLPIVYMNTVLESWHKEGCKTLAECEASSDAFRLAKAAKREADKAKKSDGTSGKEMKYGNYDSNEALLRALERSYGSDEGSFGDGEDSN